MAIRIPIISEFDGTGIKKATQQFRQLEGAGAKAQFAIRKAAIPAAAALAALAAALGDATMGAIEDQAAQTKLAAQLRKSTHATDAQIKANEDWISTQGQLLGVTDTQLRPAIAALARVTGSLTTAQKAASLAMDISSAKGISLETVTKALEKAYGGNLTALAKIAPELRTMIKDGASLDEVMAKLGATFGGAAATQADTMQGRFQRLKVALDETKESIGTALLPIVEKALPVLQKFSDWAQKHPTAFLAIAAAIGAVATAITAVNIAMMLNPFSLIAAGIALLVTGVAIAYNKFQGFRNAVNTVLNGIIDAINIVIRALNLVNPGKDIPSIPKIQNSSVNMNEADNARRFDGWSVPAMASGGIVTSPTLALIGEAGPEAVVPLGKGGGIGGDTFNIYNTSADPQKVIDAIVRWSKANGKLPSVVKVA